MILPIEPWKWPTNKYTVGIADPPWPYEGDPNKDQAAGKHYPMMTRHQLSELRVLSLFNKPAVLFVWATSPKLALAIDVGRGWGLHYRGVAFVWVKTTNAGKIIHGQGVRPSIVKPTTEYVLAFSTQKSGRPLPLLTERMEQVILAPRPGGEHSRKPVDVMASIEMLYGPLPRVELFCRGAARPGWDSWGNEATS